MQYVKNHLEDGSGNGNGGQQPNQSTQKDKETDGLQDIEQTKRDIQLAAYEAKMNRVRAGSKGEYRKRINSGGPLIQMGGRDNRFGGASLLEDIDEEVMGLQQKERGGPQNTNNNQTINVEFLKNTFQQFTLNQCDGDEQ